MTIAQTHFWIDRDSRQIGIRSANRKNGSQPFECWLNRSPNWLDFKFYEDTDSCGVELRFSFELLWFSLNMLIWTLPAREDGTRFDDRDRGWGWSILDRTLHIEWGEWKKFTCLPFITTESEGSQILSLSRNCVVWNDRNPDGTPKGFLNTFDARQKEIDRHSAAFDYTYELDNGQKQHVKAKVHVSRHLRRWKWTPFVKFEDSIWVEFSEEVGSERGSWKGGCTGCGYTLRKNETVRACLRRMERDRRFERR